MITLIATVIFGLIFAYFATQNTAITTVTLLGLSFSVPLYLLSLGSLLVGLMIAAVINSVQSLSSWIAISGKESKIRESEKVISDLSERAHQLELENVRLRGHEKDTVTEERIIHEERPKNLLERIHLISH